MTPLRFEEVYRAEWEELESLFSSLGHGHRASLEGQGDRAAALYRRACGQLALARARAYPAYLVDRLERLTTEAHQAIYAHRTSGWGALWRLISKEFPEAVRAQSRYVGAATVIFLAPAIAVGALVARTPEMILAVIDADTASSFEQMYGPSAESIGRLRDASTDWMMFAYYIRNNVGIGFQCFAGGLLAGLGSIFFLAYNGAFSGAIAAYLSGRGLQSTFFSFVATHSAFELTAIVLFGGAGLRVGYALVAPGRATRVQSLVYATRETAVLLYGATSMMLVAAVIEAFWSSSTWVSPAFKYAAAAVCWAAVLAYFTRQGGRAR